MSNATKTLQERLDAFAKMEESKCCFQVAELGLNLADQLYREGNDYVKVLSLSKMALQSLENLSISSTHYNNVIAKVLNLMGAVCYDLNKNFQSLRYFERAEEILISELEKEGSNCTDGLLDVLERSQFGLSDVKSVMGKRKEAVPHMRKVLEIRKRTSEEGCAELGAAYEFVYVAYFEAFNIKKALPYCLKALKICRKYFGRDSMEVGEILTDLGIIYCELGECEKALKQNLSAIGVLKKASPDSPKLLKARLANEVILSEIGKNEETIEVIKNVASHSGIAGSGIAYGFNCMAKGSVSLGKFDDAKRYMKMSQRIYEEEEMDPLSVAYGLEQISMLYEEMDDLEKAISLLRRVVDFPEIPQKLLLEASTRLLKLVSLVGKEEEATP